MSRWFIKLSMGGMIAPLLLFSNGSKTIDKYPMVGENDAVEIQTVTVVGETVKVAVVRPDTPGLIATADVTRLGDRLVVTQLWLAQDHHTGDGRVAEISRERLGLFDPPAIIRALTDYLINDMTAVVLGELRAWFSKSNSPTGVKWVGEVERAGRLTAGAEGPRRAGRPPKFTPDERLRWAAEVLRIDSTKPKSLWAVVARAMRESGRPDLGESEASHARDLIRELRTHKYLQPASKSGAREPLLPGPNYTIGKMNE